MLDNFRLGRKYRKYVLPNNNFRTMHQEDMDEDFIEQLKTALQGARNKYVEGKQVPYIKGYEDRYEKDWEFQREGKLQYLDPHTITGWEHDRVHRFETVKEAQEWYKNIAPVPVTNMGKHYQFTNGNHRVNMCNLLDIPIPVYVK